MNIDDNDYDDINKNCDEDDDMWFRFLLIYVGHQESSYKLSKSKRTQKKRKQVKLCHSDNNKNSANVMTPIIMR
jgi:hypothetical protein